MNTSFQKSLMVHLKSIRFYSPIIPLLYHLQMTDQVSAASLFTDVTSTYQVSSSAVNRRSASWVDIDNDGDLDLYTTHQGNNYLLQNNGSGNAFTDVTATYGIADGTTNHMSSSWIDFDNDDDMDLYSVNLGANNKLYQNNGVSTPFTDVTTTYGLADSTNQHLGANWIDFDNDGDLDAFVTSQIGYNKLFQNNGVGLAFTDVTAAYGIQTNTYQHYSASWIDIDNDGDLDVYYANIGGGYGSPLNELYQNNGVGVPFTNVGATYGVTNPGGTKYSATWADFDNDGDLDLYLPNSAPKLLQNNGPGVAFTDVSATYGLNDVAASRYSASWIDIDNDADLDLHVVQATGSNKLYQNNGIGVAFADVASSYGVTDGKRGDSWVDFDSDGDLDLYAVNSTDTNKLYSNPGQGNNYLHLVVNNTSARYQYNSRVEVDVDGNGDFSTSGTLVTQYQSNSSYSGGTQYAASQDPVGLFFGLGSDTSCKYDFRVFLPGTSPSGTPDYVYTDVCPNQKMTVSSTQPSPSPSPNPSPTPTPTPTPPPATTNSCDNSPAGAAPTLFQIDSSVDSATVYFTPVSAYSRYFLSYGMYSTAEEHSVEFDQTYSGGVISYTVNSLSPGTTYYFKIRGINNCNSGSWSDILNTKSMSNALAVPVFYSKPKVTSTKPSNNQTGQETTTPPSPTHTQSPTINNLQTAGTKHITRLRSFSVKQTFTNIKSSVAKLATKISQFFNSFFSLFKR